MFVIKLDFTASNIDIDVIKRSENRDVMDQTRDVQILIVSLILTRNIDLLDYY